MKGGVALALVGLLAVVMGVRGTYREVWAALSGQAANASAWQAAGIAPPGTTGNVLGCHGPSDDIPVPATKRCPPGYSPIYAAAAVAPTGTQIYQGGAFTLPLPNMPGNPVAQI